MSDLGSPDVVYVDLSSPDAVYLGSHLLQTLSDRGLGSDVVRQLSQLCPHPGHAFCDPGRAGGGQSTLQPGHRLPVLCPPPLQRVQSGGESLHQLTQLRVGGGAARCRHRHQHTQTLYRERRHGVLPGLRSAGD